MHSWSGGKEVCCCVVKDACNPKFAYEAEAIKKAKQLERKQKETGKRGEEERKGEAEERKGGQFQKPSYHQEGLSQSESAKW